MNINPLNASQKGNRSGENLYSCIQVTPVCFTHESEQGKIKRLNER